MEYITGQTIGLNKFELKTLNNTLGKTKKKLEKNDIIKCNRTSCDNGFIYNIVTQKKVMCDRCFGYGILKIKEL